MRWNNACYQMDANKLKKDLIILRDFMLLKENPVLDTCKEWEENQSISLQNKSSQITKPKRKNK